MTTTNHGWSGKARMGPQTGWEKLLNYLDTQRLRVLLWFNSFLLFKVHPLKVGRQVSLYRDQMVAIIGCGDSMADLYRFLTDQTMNGVNLGYNEILAVTKTGRSVNSNMINAGIYQGHIQQLARLTVLDENTARLWGRTWSWGMPLIWSYVIDWIFIPIVIWAWVWVAGL